MKYLLKYKLFENKVIDQLITKYKKHGKTIDPSDMEHFKKITKDLPNNLPRLIKWILEGEDPASVIVPYEYYLNLRNKNLKVPDINQFKTSEDLYDALQIIEQDYNSNKIVQELPSTLKRQYHFIKDKSEIDNLFLELSKQDTKGHLISKISRYKTLNELADVIKNFLSSNDEGYREKILSLQDDDGVEVKYFKDGIILAEIKSYTSSKRFGSPSWCISTMPSYFDSYTSGSKIQYLMSDNNIEIRDSLSLIGVTMKSFSSIIMSNSLEGQVGNAHDKKDYNIREKIINIIKEKNIPFSKIFFDRSAGRESILKYLYDKEIDIIIQYLMSDNNIEIRDKLFKNIVDTKNDDYLLDANIKIVSSSNSFLKNTPYFTEDTLIENLDRISIDNPKYIIKRKERFISPIIRKYYLIAIKNLDIKQIVSELGNTDNSTTSMGRYISNILIEKIKGMESKNDQFSALFEWKKRSKFISEARVLLMDIANNHLNKLNPTNKVEALKLLKNNFWASNVLEDIVDVDKNVDVLIGITMNKPLAKYKFVFLNNIINFMSRLSEDVLVKFIIDDNDNKYNNIDYIYLDKRILDIYDLIDHNDIKQYHRDFVYTLFNKCYDEYMNGSKTSQKFVKSELGFKILNDYNMNLFSSTRDQNVDILSKTFNFATPSQIKKNISIIDNYLSEKGNNILENIQCLLQTGDNDLIKKHYRIINTYLKVNTHESTMRNMIYIVFNCKKLDFSNFMSIINEITNNTNSSDNKTIMNALKKYCTFIDGDIIKFKYIIKLVSTSSYPYENRGEVIDYEVIYDIYKFMIGDLYNVINNNNNNIKNIIKELHKIYPINSDITNLFNKNKNNPVYKDIYNLMMRLSSK